MAETRYYLTRPNNRLLRWLSSSGQDVTPEVCSIMLGELLASPGAVLIGGLNGIILNSLALVMHGGPIFAVMIMAELLLAAVRTIVVAHARQAAALGAVTRTDLYMCLALSWCALQGLMTFCAMQTNIVTLQLLSATTAVAMVGPICARNYAAHHYALTLIGLCTLPMVAGAALSNDRFLLVYILQMPLLLYGSLTTLRRFQAMAIATLNAQQVSAHHARHDTLTGLLNRHGLLAKLEEYFTVPPHEFVVFYLDLDGFKAINDTFGHQAGDMVLQGVATRLRCSARGCDIMARLGGDEFVVIAPDISADEGVHFADRMIRQIADEPYVFDASVPLRIGVSVGFACAPEDGQPGRDLLQKADSALYAAKAAGKGVQRRFTPASMSGHRSASPMDLPDIAQRAA